MTDIIDDLLQRIAQALPSTPREKLIAIEVDLRRTWGGERLYVCRRPRLAKQQALARAFAAGNPSTCTAIARNAGISRSHAYRLAHSSGTNPKRR